MKGKIKTRERSWTPENASGKDERLNARMEANVSKNKNTLV